MRKMHETGPRFTTVDPIYGAVAGTRGIVPCHVAHVDAMPRGKGPLERPDRGGHRNPTTAAYAPAASSASPSRLRTARSAAGHTGREHDSAAPATAAGFCSSSSAIGGALLMKPKVRASAGRPQQKSGSTNVHRRPTLCVDTFRTAKSGARMAWDDGLTGPAREIAGSVRSPLLALAGPGTGKTYSLIRRVARLLEEGCPPARILVVTFARTAASDLVRELRTLAGGATDEVLARTLHGYCFWLLGRAGVLEATERVPRILAAFERDLILADLEPDSFGSLTKRRELTRAFEAAWARRQSDAPGGAAAGLDQTFQTALLDALRWYQAMLVGELVPLTLQYLRDSPLADERSAYDHVIVDEFQDLNRAEQELVDLLALNGSFTVMGDDDQSIYAFKWANPDGIRNFERDHPGTESVPLEECRRCPTRVVAMAASLIAHDPRRLPKVLAPSAAKAPGEIHHVQWGSLDQEAAGIAAFVAHKIDSGVDPGKVLILAPSRIVGYKVRDAMRAAGIVTRSYFQEEPLDTVDAQEALTKLNLLADHTDRVALRAWLGLRSTTQRRPAYRRLLQQARVDGVDVRDVLRRLAAGSLALPRTGDLVDRWRTLEAELARLTTLTALPTLIDDLFPAGVEALELLREIALQASPTGGSAAELASFIRGNIAQPEVPIESVDARVMSFHKSKGLTADVVVLAGLVEGLMPFSARAGQTVAEREADLEEYRRLFYVGLTRTRDVLVLSSYSWLPAATAQRLGVAHRRRGAGYVMTPSRFLSELGVELANAEAGTSWDYA